MTDMVEKAAQVLYEHDWNGKTEHCECGADSDGDQAKHQAEVLDMAGLLAPTIRVVEGVEAETPGVYVSIPVPPPDELVERVAKAIYVRQNFALDAARRAWDKVSDTVRAMYRDYALAALYALGEAE